MTGNIDNSHAAESTEARMSKLQNELARVQCMLWAACTILRECEDPYIATGPGTTLSDEDYQGLVEVVLTAKQRIECAVADADEISVGLYQQGQHKPARKRRRVRFSNVRRRRLLADMPPLGTPAHETRLGHA